MTVDSNLPSLRVATFNVNGLGNPNKRELVLNWLASKREDIIFLQETHSTTDTDREPSWNKTWKGISYLIMGLQIQLG